MPPLQISINPVSCFFLICFCPGIGSLNSSMANIDDNNSEQKLDLMSKNLMEERKKKYFISLNT